MPRIVKAVVAGALSAGIVCAGGCVKNAATGDKYFSPIGALYGKQGTRDLAIQLGTDAAPEMAKEFGGGVADARLQQYVKDIGAKLAALTEADNPTLPWEFTLLDSSVINAFALPGGKVYVTRGLAERMTNEAQLAGVLGHEIGHVTAEHAMRRIGQQQALTGALVVAGVAAASASEDSSAGKAATVLLPAVQVGGTLVVLKFGRDEESQADTLGMRYMSKGGYNPRAQQQVMQILKAASGGKGGGQPEWMSTHPLPDTRIQRIEQLLRTEFAAATNDPKNQFYEERFQREFLAGLKRLPAPSHKAEAEAARLIELAAAHRSKGIGGGVCGPGCAH